MHLKYENLTWITGFIATQHVAGGQYSTAFMLQLSQADRRLQ